MPDAVGEITAGEITGNPSGFCFQRPRISPELVVGFMKTAGDASLAWAWLNHQLSSGTTLSLQAATSCLLLCGMCGIRRAVDGRAAALFATLLLLGPFGGIAVFLQELARSVRQGSLANSCRATTALPRISQADAVFEAICQGRRPRAPGAGLTNFSSAFDSESRALQNAAIAAIARHYRPEMLPALIDALHSEVAAVRVQAAAVFAKYRTGFGNRARDLIASGVGVANAPEALARAAACREVSACGFVDAATVEALGALATALEAEADRIASAEATLSRFDGPAGQPRQRPGKRRAANAAAPRLGRYSCGGMR